MKSIDIKNIEEVKLRFEAISSKEELVELINHVNRLFYGDNCRKLNIKGLNYYSHPRFCKKRYIQFSIKKKNGGIREIHSPKKGLKGILNPLNYIFQCVSQPHHKATGFVIGKSIVDNAKPHVGKMYVFNSDLKDFFHSYDRNRVKLAFMNEPFNLKGEREPLAFLLASLCTHPLLIDGKESTVLPQGAPTSPTITNILCVNLDRRLNGLAKRLGITYSRYADDITFSSETNVFKSEKFISEFERIVIEDQKLAINNSKTRIQSKDYKQEVTGLIVNSKINVPKRYIKNIRMLLYYWEKYGYYKASQIFFKDYSIDKGHLEKRKPTLKRVLEGKLNYLKMVKGDKDPTYEKLIKRFINLSEQDSTIEKVLKIWEEEGVFEAINFYKEIIYR